MRCHLAFAILLGAVSLVGCGTSDDSPRESSEQPSKEKSAARGSTISAAPADPVAAKPDDRTAVRTAAAAADDPRDPIVVRTAKYGDLRESDIRHLREQRLKLRRVLSDALLEGYKMLALSEAFTLPNDDISLARMAEGTAERVVGPSDEEGLVLLWLLARRAQELGVEASDHFINRFFHEITQQRVTPEKWRSILERASMSDRQFFAAMRERLLASQLRQLCLSALSATTPAQRWDYLKRLRQQATIEAAPLPVGDYVAEVEDPGDQTVRAFFEEHRNDYDLPTLPTPGFRQPQRVNVRYFRLVPGEIAKSISAKDIKAYTETNQQQLERAYEAAHRRSDAKKPADEETEEEKTQGRNESEPKKPDILPEALIPEAVQPSKEKWIESRVRAELAEQQLKDAIRELQGIIRMWSQGQRDFEAHVRPTPPAPPDFQALAAKYAATTGETGLRSPAEMSELEIARSNDERMGGFLNLVFADRPYSSRAQLSKYQVGITCSLRTSSWTVEIPESVTYVFYKTEDQPERVLAWDDERTPELALAKWKQVQARKLAVAATERLAADARTAKKPLKEALPGRRVFTAGPFTWMTESLAARLMGPGEPPHLSEVEGVDRPGDDFMRAVFRLSPGEIGVALNQPKTVAYVIRLDELRRSDESLWVVFELTPPAEYADVAADELQQTYRDWLDEIKSSAGLKWERPPDLPRVEE